MVATSFWQQKMGNGINEPHGPVDYARYLALINMSLAEAGIAAWDAKFRYHIARPITYIQAKAISAGGDPTLASWTPLGQAGSNGAPDGVTPPFPAYPSGHAVFGGAIFKMIADVTKKNKTDPSSAFSFVSDEYNGHTFGADGNIRPYMEVHYPTLGFAEWENAESRVWLGIHWQMDADDGTQLGEQIADAIFQRSLNALPSQ
jgi:hypothetical protein